MVRNLVMDVFTTFRTERNAPTKKVIAFVMTNIRLNKGDQPLNNWNCFNMPTKVFTMMGGGCPFGKGCEVDTPACRRCEFFYRAGTGTFFWCRHPDERAKEQVATEESAGRESTTDASATKKTKGRKIARKVPEIEQPKRKRGRPPGKATKKAANKRKMKK